MTDQRKTKSIEEIRNWYQLQTFNMAREDVLTVLSAYEKAVWALKEINDCFDAAIAEGLYEALNQTQDHRLKDLVERRLLWAKEKTLHEIGEEV